MRKSYSRSADQPTYDPAKVAAAARGRWREILHNVAGISGFENDQYDLYPNAELARDLRNLRVVELPSRGFRLVAKTTRDGHGDMGISYSIAAPAAIALCSGFRRMTAEDSAGFRATPDPRRHGLASTSRHTAAHHEIASPFNVFGTKAAARRARQHDYDADGNWCDEELGR